ncbi:MAG: ABC transporter ATP-binding protein [Nitrososphaerota archaeon]|nr:ABC transporter ATP-binding protein [Nitrososphaerota archaeon]
MDSVLELNQAVKDYGSRVIGPLSFSVGRGEVVGLLGPNGSGKSTSIRMALGLARPTTGEVRLMGMDPYRQHSRALVGVGYSPELPNLQTFMTPAELLTLVGRELSLKRSEIDAQTPKVLENVGLLAYRDYRIGKLSKGMVQRLSVAQAMMGSPSLLILDEPMIGIDPAGVVHFRSIFREFVSGGGTIIMSSHIMSEVENLCSSVAVVHSGKLVFRGGISDFIESSLNSRLILVEVRTPSPALVEKLRVIPGVRSVTATEGSLAITAEKGTDLRSEISSAVVAMDAGLLSIGYSRSEIDEAYVAAIRGSG